MTTKPDQIKNLAAAGIDEDTIVSHLGISHMYYRRHTHRPAPKLTPGARREVQLLDNGMTITEMAQAYATTTSQIRHARYYTASRATVLPTEAEAMAHLQQHDSPELLKRDYKLTPAQLTHYLILCGWQPAPQPTTTARLPKADIMDSSLPAKELAKQHGCSAAYVYKLRAMAKQPTPQRPDWAKITAYAREHGPSAAASLFNVKRASVYYHLQKASQI